jgi:MFS family permease
VVSVVKSPIPAYEHPDEDRPASASPTEDDLECELPGGSRSAGHDPYAALRDRQYRLYVSGYIVSVIGRQMLAVAIGWELYERTRSATALGLVGLVQAIPIVLLALPAGQLADVLDRRRIVLATQLVQALSSTGLAMTSIFHAAIPYAVPLRMGNSLLRGVATSLGETGSRFDDPGIPVMYLLLFLLGTARAFHGPARDSLLPGIVPGGIFANAITWSTSGFQVASTVGPALGGFLIAQNEGTRYSAAVVYLADVACALTMFVLFLGITRVRREPRTGEPPSLRSLAAGIKFVWETKIILATITLDLFAVLLGGATVLLPIFAEEILHTSAFGFGLLRAAPSIGAMVMALVMAHRPPMRQAGKALLWAVIGFGAATIVFGLSRSFALSLVMLALTGAFDNVSVVVRHTLVQVLTPDTMRGRVSAVNAVFIGSSNELGALESGLTAAAFGPIVSVVGGGIGTILVVLGVAAIWPEVRRFGRLDRAGES